ncbi:hypothetical protein [Paraburkholderia unamae]|uniref:Uncharacterized protein n=1 Tax=Paraburkholderia unamae TaxID=219649 RepID=A0ACC6RKS4_9BURK
MKPNNPLELNNWMNVDATVGASETGDDLQAGRVNEGYYNDATVVRSKSADNAALVGENIEDNHGGIGLFGLSWSQHNGVGTSGFCPSGVGSYGISTTGVGVVGRVMRDDDVRAEDGDAALETQAPGVGVFGQSVGGTGIRGHGGSFRKKLRNETNIRNIGAVLSAGNLVEGQIPSPTPHPVEFSNDITPQLQLIPSAAVSKDGVFGQPKLPVEGRIGEFLLVLDSNGVARLFICTHFGRDPNGNNSLKPVWQPVQLGNGFFGGRAIP